MMRFRIEFQMKCLDQRSLSMDEHPDLASTGNHLLDAQSVNSFLIFSKGQHTFSYILFHQFC